MDDTRTLSFDLTDYIERPHLDEPCGNKPPSEAVDEVDPLEDARGVIRGLAIAMSGWALVVLIMMLLM